MTTPLTARLIERFPVQSFVDVLLRAPASLSGPAGEEWFPGLVVAHDHPAVWVTAAGGRWFVTSGKRIRSRARAFKIATSAECAEMDRTGAFPGSAADLRDGFVHLSAEEQVAETRRRHFEGQTDLVLLEIDLTAVDARRPGSVRWEVSRGGAWFPHVYGPLAADAVLRRGNCV